MKMQHLSAITLALILSACASTKPANVMPMAGGQYRTTGFGEDENAAQGAALKAAQAACEKQSRRLEVVSTQTKYKGVVSEDTNKNLATAGKLASYVGAWVPTLTDDNDYEVTLQFTCAA
ncbi:hypothetical protein [Herbaspirillum huttiense]|uniref:hypothetical protein n=1 Tax=Herbaspirillum huttiense TaxID=863372 RepID=UPI003F2DD143